MTERELSRNAARRLAIIRHAQEVTGNVAKTCRYYGITRQADYKWLRRYESPLPDSCGPGDDEDQRLTDGGMNPHKAV